MTGEAEFVCGMHTFKIPGYFWYVSLMFRVEERTFFERFVVSTVFATNPRYAFKEKQKYT